MNLVSGALNKEEFERLGAFLANCEGGEAMNLEELDGFFAALMACPQLVPPSEYLVEVMGPEGLFEGEEQAQEILPLILRHWNSVEDALHTGKPYPLYLLPGPDGSSPANDWARGFIRGLKMRPRSWQPLLDDDERRQWIAPAFLLYSEAHEAPEIRSGPYSAEQREGILEAMVAGLTLAYDYFASQRELNAVSKEPARGAYKIGRNEPCPCGSGKKYKRCHGAVH